jgi:type II secretory pathway pseudopilin PulG
MPDRAISPPLQSHTSVPALSCVARKRRVRSNRLLVWVLVGLIAAMAGTGCKKAKEERKASAEAEAAQSAIAAYSKASDEANAAHRAVLDAFAAANRSASLSAYKTALRSDVLPKLDAFIAKLEAMPTATPELAAIHKPLLAAYKKARADLDAFEAKLTDPTALGQFDTIRQALQTAVKTYHEQLAAYYQKNARQLRLAKEEAAAQAEGVTPTSASAEATPTGAAPALPAAATPASK